MLTQLRFIYAFIGLAKNPDKTTLTAEISDTLVKLAGDEKLTKLESNLKIIFPKTYQDFVNGVAIKPLDHEQFSDFPKHTLGYKYYEHLNSHGIAADYYRKVRITRFIDYVRVKLRNDHDLHHTITNSSINWYDEILLQAFSAGQFPHGTHIAIISAGILHTVFSGQLGIFGQLITDISKYYEIGLAANKVIEVNWNTYLDRDLDEVRKELNINLR